jgi:hypothetical protein
VQIRWAKWTRISGLFVMASGALLMEQRIPGFMLDAFEWSPAKVVPQASKKYAAPARIAAPVLPDILCFASAFFVRSNRAYLPLDFRILLTASAERSSPLAHQSLWTRTASIGFTDFIR